MFDDQPANPGASAPKNLPFGEPQDIFASTDGQSAIPPLSPAEMAPLTGGPVEPQTSALEAGILRPKPQPNLPPQPLPPQGNFGNGNNGMEGIAPSNSIKEPRLSHGIMMTIMIVVVGFILVGSGWFVYQVFMKEDETTEPIVDNQIDDVPVQNDIPVLPSNENQPLEEVTILTTSSDAVDQEIILGESIDSDGDGVKDNREVELGTNPSNWDSDNDGLGDGEELLIWHTNPKNDDTDGDTYKDGTEVKAGYNPSGPGKLAEIGTVSMTPTSSSNDSFVNTPMASSSASSTVASTSTPTNTTYEIEL